MTKSQPRTAKPGQVKAPTEQRNNLLHATLRELRHKQESARAEQVGQLRQELGLRPLGQADVHPTAVTQLLVFMHELLGRLGAKGVGAMDSKMLGQALAQAQVLAKQEASPGLTALIEQLRLFQVAAELRQVRKALPARTDKPPKAKEPKASRKDFENTEIVWMTTVSPHD